MTYEHLSETVVIKTVSENDRQGVFEIEGLYTGYGTTLGNSLRRVLLSSLPGAAVTQVRIKGVSHEFSTIPGIAEDMIEILLHVKRIRLRMHTDEPQTLSLKAKGEGKVTAADIKTTSEVEVITPEVPIVTMTDKSAEFDMELTIERGLGYVPAEMRRSEKLSIGVVAVDAIFSPVTKVNFTVENMRVGDRTDYHRLRMDLETDGSITPSQAIKTAAQILTDHFAKVAEIETKMPAKTAVVTEEKKKKSTRAKKEK